MARASRAHEAPSLALAVYAPLFRGTYWSLRRPTVTARSSLLPCTYIFFFACIAGLGIRRVARFKEWPSGLFFLESVDGDRPILVLARTLKGFYGYLRRASGPARALPPRGSKSLRCVTALPSGVEPRVAFFSHFLTILCDKQTSVAFRNEKTTLSGGSLGSCVDEERSQLRELM